MSANSNRPTFLAYVITERTGKKNIWTQIGAAWPNRDAKGFTIKLHAFPANAEIVLREPLQDQEDHAEQNRPDEDIPF